MYKSQKGFFPFICTVTGLILFVYPTFIALVNGIYELYSDFSLANLILRIFASILVLSFPLGISFLLLKMFPRVRIFEDGIQLLSFPLSITTIKWDQMDGIERFKNGYAAIVFQKEGFYLLNGTYFNMAYGMLVHTYKPVVLLSPSILANTKLVEILKEKHVSGSSNNTWR